MEKRVAIVLITEESNFDERNGQEMVKKWSRNGQEMVN